MDIGCCNYLLNLEGPGKDEVSREKLTNFNQSFGLSTEDKLSIFLPLCFYVFLFIDRPGSGGSQSIYDIYYIEKTQKIFF